MIGKICIAPNETSIYISAQGLKAHVDTWCDADFAVHCCFLNIYCILENNSYSFSHENLLQISTFKCDII